MSTVTPNPRRWWALALLCGAFFMVILDANIVVVALPSIEEALSFSEQGLQWVISAYALTFAGLLLLGGRAADLLGRRRLFMVGLLLFTVASLVCGLAWSPGALIGARAIQGIGAAIMTPTALSIISTMFEGAERNRALAIWGMNGAFGATAGYLIGGLLVDGPGWEWIFFINIPVGLAALVLCPMLVRESRETTARRSYDPGGALSITGALVLLVYALVEAPDAGWGSPKTILLFTTAAALVAIFAVIESRHPSPLVPLRLLRSRTLVGANAVMLLFATAGAGGMPFIITLYAQQVLGYSPVEFGVAFVVTPVAAAAGMIVAQAAVAKVGFRPVAATGMALLAAGTFLLTQVSVGGSYWGDLFPGLLVCGLSVGPAFATATIAALAGVAEREAGLASGLSNTAFQLGGALGVAIASTVAISRSEDYLAANGGANPLVVLNEGFQSALVACVVLAGIGAVLALLLLGPPRKARQRRLQPAAATAAE
jgi:EmrB/QacA subfamily drug resistance transporter